MMENIPDPAEAEGAAKPFRPLRIQRVPRIGGSEARAGGAVDQTRENQLAELNVLMNSVKSLSERISGTLGQEESAAKAKPRDKSNNRTKTPHQGLAATLTSPRRAARKAAATRRRKNPLLLWAAAQAFGFGLVALGFVFGKADGAPPQADAAAQNAVESSRLAASDEPQVSAFAAQRFQRVNELMAAGRKGDAAKARQMLEDAQRRGPDLPGSDYRLALLALQRGDLPEAKLRLNCAAAANEQPAACAYVQAMLAGAAGDYNRVASEMEGAAYAEPFSARYLFFWGEALRRAGKAQAAVERLEQALLRPCDARDAEYIAFKLRLAKIEAGRGDELSGELAENLRAKRAAPAWLLTAAAREKHRGEDAAAARYLQEAERNAAAPEEMQQPLRDFFFAARFAREELTPYLNVTAGKAPAKAGAAGAAAINADPALWTIQAADPGAWPTL